MARRLQSWGFAIGVGLLWLIAIASLLDRLSPPDLARYRTQSVAVIDRHGEVLRTFATKEGAWRLPADPAKVDPLYLKILLAYEDHRFADHPGVDPFAVLRAFWQLAEQGHVVSGASTITMQTARLLEPRRRTLGSKLIEAVRALQLEHRYSKQEILAAYLTLVPCGGSLEGIRAASLAYFGKEPRRLTEGEAALLVALPRDPEHLRPDRFPEAARRARNAVLERAAAAGVIDAEAARRAEAEPVPSARLPMPFLAPHLAERLAAAAQPGEAEIATTLDADLQARLEALLQRQVQGLDRSVGVAAIVIDNRDMSVRAYAGAADYFDEQRLGMINMAAAIRSPGSALKPFIYGIAFDRLIVHPDTLIDDTRRDFGGYIPGNFDDGFHGEVTVREALQRSLNIPAVKLLDRIGPISFDAALQRVGVSLRFNRDKGPPALPLALGGAGIDLEDLVMLYAALPAGGEVRSLRFLATDRAADRGRLMGPAAAWYVADILQGVPTPDGRLDSAVAAHRALGFKTGTSYGYRDAWAVGFTADATIGVWVGRADGTSCSECIGMQSAAPLLFGVADLLPPAQPVAAAAPPPGVIAGPTDVLPEGLRRFADNAGPLAAIRGIDRPLRITFPLDGSTVMLDPAGAAAPLALRASGGRGALTWIVNGQPLQTGAHRWDGSWTPDGDGFAEIEVMDSAGNSDSAEVFLQAADGDAAPLRPSALQPATQ
jgi:penicillin-binding protein 1C